MIKLALITLGIFAFSATAGSVPGRKIDTNATAPFSLESWVSGIIADPDGAHLGPDEAYALAVNQTKNDSGTLEKGVVRCVSRGGTSAAVADVIACVSSLAHRAGQRCSAGFGGRSFCRHGSATIEGLGDSPVCRRRTSTCGYVALAATRIIGKCTRGGRVQGLNTGYVNGNVTVYIRGF